MNKEIKKILRDLELCNGVFDFIIEPDDSKLLIDYIKSLQQENKELKNLYQETYKHLFSIGHDELARYFQAQICECNVFTPQ